MYGVPLSIVLAWPAIHVRELARRVIQDLGVSDTPTGK